MQSRPTIYLGYPRFSHSGFSFLLVDPWPEYWPENWYEADDVYIDMTTDITFTTAGIRASDLRSLSYCS